MKKVKRIVALLLTASIVLPCVACKKEEEKSAIKTNKEIGTHVMTAEDTDEYFVQNGVSKYEIVVPATQFDETTKDSKLEIACNELQYFVQKATDVKLRIISDDNTLENGKYLSLGRTTLFEQTDIDVSFDLLGTDGVRIVSEDNVTYFAGNTSMGVIFAVYDFLEIMFDYDCFYQDCYQINTGLKDVRMKDFDVMDIPDFPLRAYNYGFQKIVTSGTYDRQMYGYRMRTYYSPEDLYLPIYKEADGTKNSPNKYAHNSFYYIPPEQYYDEHPQWFANDKTQLCYTGGGKEENFLAMTRLCADKIINSLKIYRPDKYPLYKTVSITTEDTQTSCKCEACLALAKQYGTITAANIIFNNKVNEYVREWMNAPENAEYYRDGFIINFFAYNSYLNPPTKYNEKTGKYEALSKEVELAEGTGVWFAPFAPIDYQLSLWSEMNSTGKAQLDGWMALTDNIDLWFYATNYTQYAPFYDRFPFYEEAMYQYLAESKKINMYWSQTQFKAYNSATGFCYLQSYLEMKSVWNVNVDHAELTKKFFNAMYSDASDTMYDLFMGLRMHMQYTNKKYNLYRGGSGYVNYINKNYWPLTTLKQFTSLIDQSLGKIEKYKDVDQKYYDSLWRHIESEWFEFGFLLLEMYKDDLAKADRTALVNRFIDDVKTLQFGSSVLSESNTTYDKYIQDLY